MKVLSPILSAALLVGCGGTRDGIVARTDFDVPMSWIRPKIAGRDFRMVMHNEGYWANGGKAFAADARRFETNALPAFAECGVTYKARKTDGLRRIVSGGEWPFLKDYARWDTGAVIRTGIALKDFFTDDAWRALEERNRPEQPFFVTAAAARPPFFLEKDYSTDREGFSAWKRDNPNFLGFITLSEFDSDSWYYNWKARQLEDRTLKDRLVSAYPLPQNQYGWTNLVGEAWQRVSNLLFGERAFWPMCSGYYSYCHIFGRFGAAGLCYESTGQGCPRWQVSGAFVRGAARQFELPFLWYQAHFLTMYERGKWDKQQCGDNRWNQKRDPFGGPYVGISQSLFSRQTAYGWLIGATFNSVEDWPNLFSEPDGDGIRRVNGFARDFNDVYELSKRIDRGVTYTPVALLVPLCDRYNCWGATEGAIDNFSQNSFYLTLLPIHSDIRQCQLHRRGIEGGFFNSPFGEIYDVLAADSGQDSADFRKALSAYKCAFLVGSYRKGDLDGDALSDYVSNGGTLFVSADQVADGRVSPKLAGVRFGAEADESSGTVVFPDGETFALENPYRWVRGQASEGTPWLKDANGAVAAYVHDVGCGRVVTVCARGMRPTPELSVADVAEGRKSYEVIRMLLARVQEETMPVLVKGDVQWGVNRTETGYLLWLFNNKGVVHYSGEKPLVDETAIAEVRVLLRKDSVCGDVKTGERFEPHGNSFALRVDPGAYRLVSVECAHMSKVLSCHLVLGDL